jgi:hypothetical protein
MFSFSAFQAIHFPALEAIHFPALPSEPPTVLLQGQLQCHHTPTRKRKERDANSAQQDGLAVIILRLVVDLRHV